MHRGIQPDLVLVDLRMPGLGGLEVLEKLKSHDPDYVAIVITGHGTIRSAVEAMKLGAYDFLPKPFTPNQLRFIVERGLERRRSLKETARLRREKQLMRDNFVSMVSHELRAPLAAVQQRLMLVTGGYTGAISEPSRMSILGTQKRIKALISLINDWLDLSRIDSGGIAEPVERLDVNTILHEVLETLGPLARDRDLGIEIDAREPPTQVRGNRDMLRMVFTNLVHNAIKYNRDGGRVLIRSAEEGGDITVTVEDTGVGIPSDILPMVFEQFYRVKGKGLAEGSGLGLSISKRIVELHSGSITAESEIGKGSVFVVRLPALGRESDTPDK
jgi:signal transduction histidine kinase